MKGFWKISSSFIHGEQSEGGGGGRVDGSGSSRENYEREKEREDPKFIDKRFVFNYPVHWCSFIRFRVMWSVVIKKGLRGGCRSLSMEHGAGRMDGYVSMKEGCRSPRFVSFSIFHWLFFCFLFHNHLSLFSFSFSLSRPLSIRLVLCFLSGGRDRCGWRVA